MFNVAQLTASAALGFMVVALVAPETDLDVARVSGVLGAVLVFLLANRAAVSGVLAVAGAGAFWDDFRETSAPMP